MVEIETLPQPALSDGPMPVKEYRALSVWAIVALVLGLLSPLAIVAPLLGIVPLVAMVIGGVALRRIAIHSDRISGRWMALAPFVLAPLFLGWGFSREFSRRERFFGHAREFTDDWLSILNRNQPYLAHQFRLQAKDRLDTNMNYEIAYQQNAEATDQFQRFRETSPMKEILAAAPDATIQFEDFLQHKHLGFVDVVTLQYAYETPTSGKSRCWITVKRTYSIYTTRADWVISDVVTQKPRGT